MKSLKSSLLNRSIKNLALRSTAAKPVINRSRLATLCIATQSTYIYSIQASPIASTPKSKSETPTKPCINTTQLSKVHNIKSCSVFKGDLSALYSLACLVFSLEDGASPQCRKYKVRCSKASGATGQELTDRFTLSCNQDTNER